MESREDQEQAGIAEGQAFSAQMVGAAAQAQQNENDAVAVENIADEDSSDTLSAQIRAGIVANLEDFTFSGQ